MRRLLSLLSAALILLGCTSVRRHTAEQIRVLNPTLVILPYTRPSSAPSQKAQPAAAETPAPTHLRVLCGETVRQMPTQEYLVGCVAAEMPASFEFEALKAQAVAARSYAIYSACARRHADADLCTSSVCCQAWLDADALRERWGDRFGEYLSRIERAVSETDGEYLSYEGKAVFAAFHASSAGRTEDCGVLWNALPYLVSVDSPETAETVPDFISVLELSALDFRDTLLRECPAADFTDDAADWVQAEERDDSGRVRRLTIGGAEFTGARLRTLFSLRSTCFTLEYTGALFRFTVAGSGHGVGMSQYGATLLAADGADYREILAHYYPGALLVK